MQSLITRRLLPNNLFHIMKNSKGFAMTGKWHIDRSISVGHIISTISLLILIGAAYSNMNTRIETQSVRIDSVEQRIDRETQRQQQDMATIRQSLNRIEDRLERLSEVK